MIRNALIRAAESRSVVGLVSRDEPQNWLYGRILFVSGDSFQWEALDDDGRVCGEDVMPIANLMRLRLNPREWNRRFLERCGSIPSQEPPGPSDAAGLAKELLRGNQEVDGETR